MDIPTVDTFGGWALTGLLGISGAFAMWLRLNKTQTEVKRANTEGGWLTQLVTDRDEAIKRADEAVDREKLLTIKYDEVKAENNALKWQAVTRDEKIDNLNKRVDMLTALVIELRPDLATFLNSPAFGGKTPIV